MSGKKYSFSKDIAESLGITEAIILDFYQNNHQDLSLDNLKNEFKFLEVSQLENSFKRLVKLGLLNRSLSTNDSFTEADETNSFYPSEDLIKQAINLSLIHI